MLKSEVEIGGVYIVRWHDGSFTEVEILRPMRRRSYGGYSRRSKDMTHYQAKNLKTGRLVEIKSAAKLRRRVR